MQILYQLIDMRSFPTLWYWICLACTWSIVSHRALGVPYDMLSRARRKIARGEADSHEAGADIITLVRLSLKRIHTVSTEGGVVATAALSCLFSLILISGFGYGYEFPQALAMLTVPLMLVLALSVRAAHKLAPLLDTAEPDPQAVIAFLLRHRLHVQLIGIAAIVISTLWGMVHNMQYYFL